MDALQALKEVESEMRARAAQYLMAAKGYTCKTTAPIRSGLVKGAAVSVLDADLVQKVINMMERGDEKTETEKTEDRPA